MTRFARRWAVLLVVALAVVAALVIGAHRGGGPASLAQRTQSVASQVRCPVCGGETAAQSQTAAAVAIRNQIRQELAGGVPAARVLDDLAAAYGPSILERPPAKGFGLLVWVLPIVAVVLAAIGLVLAFARWQRARPAGRRSAAGERAPPATDAGDEALVARAMAGPPRGDGPDTTTAGRTGGR